MSQTIRFKLHFADASMHNLNLRALYYDSIGKLITASSTTINKSGYFLMDSQYVKELVSFPNKILLRLGTKNFGEILLPTQQIILDAQNYKGDTITEANTIYVYFDESKVQQDIKLGQFEESNTKSKLLSDIDKQNTAQYLPPDKGTPVPEPQPTSGPSVISTSSNLTTAGSALAAESHTADIQFFGNDEVIKFPETPSAPQTMAPPVAQDFMMRGRIINTSGEALKNTNFIVYAEKKSEKKSETGNLVPLLSSKTDNLGSFQVRVPNEHFVQAGATVGKDTETLIEIILKDGKLPDFTLLVSAYKSETLEGESDDDCGCHDHDETDRLPDMEDLISGKYQQDIGGSCVNFTTPNRALEEFTYHNVVRLTDPQIINAPGYVENLKTRIAKLDKALKDYRSGQNQTQQQGQAQRTSSIIRSGFTQLKNDIIAKANNTTTNGITRREIELYTLELFASALQAQEPITPLFNLSAFPYFHNETEQTVVNNKFFNFTIANFFSNTTERTNYVNTIVQKIDQLITNQSQFLGLPTNPTNVTITPAAVNSQFITALNNFKTTLTNYKTNSVFVSMKSIEDQMLQIVNSVPNTETFFTGFNRTTPYHFFSASVNTTVLVGLSPINPYTADFRTLRQELRLFNHTFVQEIDRVISIVNNYLLRQRVHLLNLQISQTYQSSNNNTSINANFGPPPMQAMMLDETWMENELSRLQLLLEEALSRDYSAHARRQINSQNQIQWDAPMPLVQAASISHGHLLTYRQVWRADGYSMGDLLYSLPLAPGQQKQIAVKDWDRKDSASRSSSITLEDSLSNTLSQDRDINEIVSANLSENIEASSKATTKGASIGGGSSLGASAAVPVGGVPVNLKAGFTGGMSMGVGTGSSEASQTAARNLSGNNMNQLRMKTMQNASAVRSQRTTVVSTIEQSETSSVTTESVGNYNHCHAITIQYFEVLRHLAVHTELVDVQECLFIPLSVSIFDDQKVMRWSDLLKPALRAPLYQYDRLLKGFEAVRRFYELNYLGRPEAEVYYNVPRGRFCDEQIRKISGSIKLRIKLTCPAKTLRPMDANLSALYQNFSASNSNTLLLGGMHLSDILIDQDEDRKKWQEQLGFISEIENIRIRVNRAPDHEREQVFQNEMQRVNAISQLALNLKLIIGTPDLNELPSRIVLSSGSSMRNSRFRGETPIYDFTFSTLSNTLISDREDIISFGIRLGWSGQMPSGSMVLLEHIRAEYETDYNHAELCDGRPAIDLVTNNGAIRTPMHETEMVSPRAEDLRMRNELLDHINGNLEYYHKAIWVQMDEDRRLMLLEGFQIQVPPRENPHYAPGNGEPQYLFGDNPAVPNFMSLASVIENRLISIAGNSLVMPVAKGFNLNPNFRYINDEVELDGKKVSRLMLHYMPEKGFKETPFRISIPTKGVFAEAVMGACNSCEKIDNTRYWKWEEHPIPNSPTAIDSVSLSGQNNNQAMSLSDPTFTDKGLISQQTGVALEKADSLATAFSNLNKSSFNDYTGLSENQKNAAFALASQTAAAQTYAKAAADIAKSMEIPKNGDMVVESIKRNVQNPEKQKEFIEQYYANALGGGAGSKPSGAPGKLIDKAADSDKGSFSTTNADGSKEEISFENSGDKKPKAPGESDKDDEEKEEGKGIFDFSEDIDLSDPDLLDKRAIIDGALGDLLPIFEQHLGFTFSTEHDGPVPGAPADDDEPDSSVDAGE
jgi:hypothetical protein